MAKVEEKLFQNRYRVDADRPHIRIKEDVFYKNPSLAQDCATCCPAGCWISSDTGRKHRRRTWPAPGRTAWRVWRPASRRLGNGCPV